MAGPAPGGVGATALGVARLRAEEARRGDRLVEDPYAERILAAAARAGSVWSSPPRDVLAFVELLADQVAVRTRFLDEALLDAVGPGGGQVALLGCGMDTRAFRLRWPAGVRVFEVDFAEVLVFRDDALGAGSPSGAAARCDRVPVGADLREDWPAAVREAGFDPTLPTAWLAEGLLYALPPDAADVLLDRITELSAPGSTLAFDQISDSAALRAARAEVAPELVDLWQGGPVDVDAWLSARGWRPRIADLREVAARSGRAVHAAVAGDPAGPARAWLGTATLPG